MTHNPIRSPVAVEAIKAGASVVRTLLWAVVICFTLAPIAGYMILKLIVNAPVPASDGQAAGNALGQASRPGQEHPSRRSAPSQAPALTWPISQFEQVSATHRVKTEGARVRVDRWLYGVPSSGSPFGALTFVQGDDDRFHRNGFIGEVLQAVHVNGRATVTGPYYTLTTRYGRFNGRDVVIDDGFRKRTCIGFVSAFDMPYAVVGGMYCASAGRTADPLPVACLIDAIRFSRVDVQPSLAALAELSETAPPRCQSQSHHEQPPSSVRQRRVM